MLLLLDDIEGLLKTPNRDEVGGSSDGDASQVLDSISGLLLMV